MKKPSWKTTLFGVLAAAGKALQDNSAGSLSQIGGIVSMVALALTGFFAADQSATK